MIFTASSRLGDFFLTWPVASWYYKTHNEKIHWVLPDASNKYNEHLFIERKNLQKIIKLLLYQDFTEKITYVPCGPSWQINPSDYGIVGNYVNFGVWWTKGFDYISNIYAKKYDFGIDKDYVIKYRKMDVPSFNDIWIETAPWRNNIGSLKNIIPPDAHELNQEDDIEYNINLAMNAKNVWTNGGGFAILLDLLKKPMIIHKSQAEFNVGDKTAFRFICFPGEGFPEHRYIWHN